MASEPLKVFISYSHDSPEHARRVLVLAERLRKDGIDAQIDQYVAGTPPEGWPRWMLDRLDWAEFVLLICTETYYRRFRGHEEPGKGKGVDWEGNLITSEIYKDTSRTTKFVPVLFASQSEEFIPEPLQGVSHYVLDPSDQTSAANYSALLAFFRGRARITPAPLGLPKEIEIRGAPPLTFAKEEWRTA